LNASLLEEDDISFFESTFLEHSDTRIVLYFDFSVCRGIQLGNLIDHISSDGPIGERCTGFGGLIVFRVSGKGVFS